MLKRFIYSSFHTVNETVGMSETVKMTETVEMTETIELTEIPQVFSKADPKKAEIPAHHPGYYNEEFSEDFHKVIHFHTIFKSNQDRNLYLQMFGPLETEYGRSWFRRPESLAMNLDSKYVTVDSSLEGKFQRSVEEFDLLIEEENNESGFYSNLPEEDDLLNTADYDEESFEYTLENTHDTQRDAQLDSHLDSQLDFQRETQRALEFDALGDELQNIDSFDKDLESILIDSEPVEEEPYHRKHSDDDYECEDFTDDEIEDGRDSSLLRAPALGGFRGSHESLNDFFARNTFAPNTFSPTATQAHDSETVYDDIHREDLYVEYPEDDEYYVGDDSSNLEHTREIPLQEMTDFEAFKDIAIENVKGIFVFVHGYCDHSTRTMASLGYERMCNEEGMLIVTYDQYGHGLSEGDRGLLPSIDSLALDLLDVIDHVKNEFPGIPIVVSGMSLGGLVNITAHLKRPDEHVSDGIVLVSPLIELAMEVTPLMQTATSLICSMGLGNFRVIPPVVRNYRHKELLKQFQDDPLVYSGNVPIQTGRSIMNGLQAMKQNITLLNRYPILGQFGTLDTITSINGGYFLKNTLDESFEFKVYEGSEHMIYQEPTVEAKARVDCIHFLRKVCKKTLRRINTDYKLD